MSAAEEIVKLIEGDDRPPFNLETHIGSALYLVARKCRHPLVRRRALEVLKQYLEQDGMWNLRKYYNVALRNMELEERRVSHLPVEQRIPEDQDRFCETIAADEGFHDNSVSVTVVLKATPGCELKTLTEIVRW